MLGGYKLIDFGGVDISTSKTISGIYNEIEKTEKRIVGCNLKLGTTTFKELTLDVKKVGTDFVLTNSVIKVVIGSDNAIVGLAFTDDNSSNKKIYWHTIQFQRGGTADLSSFSRLYGYMIILSNSSTSLTIETWKQLIATDGFIGVVINGVGSDIGASDMKNLYTLERIENVDENSIVAYYRDSDNVVIKSDNISINSGWYAFNDLGVNTIN